jgi:hypothetical protein
VGADSKLNLRPVDASMELPHRLGIAKTLAAVTFQVPEGVRLGVLHRRIEWMEAGCRKRNADYHLRGLMTAMP